jgi:peroxiredoxin
MRSFAFTRLSLTHRPDWSITSRIRIFSAFLGAVLWCTAAFAAPPSVGQKAPDFTLSTPMGTRIQFSKVYRKSTVVLVVLRGFPGYQCPYCQKQAHDFIEHASGFAGKKASVLLVYPGPPADLDQHAREFLAKQADLPANITLVTDPDYAMTNRYNLRWDAPAETAYPSTFIVDRDGTIRFERISRTHDDRSLAEDILTRVSVL